jgi:hypothetical protein
VGERPGKLAGTDLSAERPRKLFALLRDASTDEHQQSRTVDRWLGFGDGDGRACGDSWVRFASAMTRRCERQRAACDVKPIHERRVQSERHRVDRNRPRV